MPVLSELRPDTTLLSPDFDGYKLSLEKVPLYKHEFTSCVEPREQTSEQFSFLYARTFGLHNHLHGDPWVKGHVYYFNKDRELIKNVWDGDRRNFETLVVTKLEASSSAKKGDFNPTLILDSPNHAVISDGQEDSYVKIYNTGDRNTCSPWQEEAKIKVEKACNVKGIVYDQEKNEMHILLESIVQAESVPELKYHQEKGNCSESATLVSWLTINPTLGSGEDCIVSERKICVPGAVEYLTLEEGGQALYIASQKEAIFTFDSARPCTPPLERALREPINYSWDQTEKEVVITFSLHSAIDDKSLQVEVDDEQKRLQVTINGPELKKKIIDGTMAFKVEKETSLSTKDNIVEIRLTKVEADQTWEEFIADDPHGARVPDKDKLKATMESLEKFTTDDKNDDGGFTSGFNPAQLEECDSDDVSSRFVRLTISSHIPSHTIPLSSHQWIGSCRPPSPGSMAMLLRHDVDALAWQPQAPTEEPWCMSHLATFPGFGYVQASKTSRKWVMTPSGFGWIAIVDGQQHIYIYHQPQPLQTTLTNRKSGQKVRSIAKQQLVSLPDNTARVLGAYPEDNKLYILHKNSLLVLSIVQD